MTVQLHPEAGLLVDYAAGSLSPALCVSITAHMHFCDKCRAQDIALSEIGGDLLSRITPEEMPANALEKVLLSLDSAEISDQALPANSDQVLPTNSDQVLPTNSDQVLPTNSDQVLPTNSDQVLPTNNEDMKKLPAFMSNLIAEPQYNFLTRSLKVAKIPIGEDKYELALHKISAGGKTPMHDHRGMEVTVVLYGSFSDLDGVYNEGDFIIRQPGDVHSPLAAKDDECICLSVVEAPIRLVGPIMRVINPFLSFSPA